MPKNHITFYFDVISPWAQVGFRVLQRYVDIWDAEVAWKPLNLGRVMQISGNKPPITVQNKGRWMNEDMSRAEVFYGLKLRMPTGFPVNTQYAQCVLRALQDAGIESAPFQKATAALMEALWTHDLPVQTADDVRKILEPANVAKKEMLEEALKQAEKKESRDRLTAESKQAVEEGMFGAPWFVVKRASDGETARFFGSDRFEQIAAFLHKDYKGPFANDSRPKL
ncbi:thioredoxin-like protein [Tilletiopsis washingtonensis]|uniref:Glutathione S-transferase kappa n=1 Tax=Tilletiopsis washingtonensis TaxID=58919 RepID=A0A316Z103_9BASI|nr:thioredoxin-like protein [Tilletiopsis washingtonensis]PWN95457.1 thioredoxin-like protein [Tilletiopsis washingtonensis]